MAKWLLTPRNGSACSSARPAMPRPLGCHMISTFNSKPLTYSLIVTDSCFYLDLHHGFLQSKFQYSGRSYILCLEPMGSHSFSNDYGCLQNCCHDGLVAAHCQSFLSRHLSWKKLRFRIGFEATNMVVQPPCNRLSPTETIMVQHRAARRPTFWMPFFSAIPWSTLTSRISGKMCPVRFTDLGLSVEGMGFWLLSEVGIGLYYVHYIYIYTHMYVCMYLYIYTCIIVCK